MQTAWIQKAAQSYGQHLVVQRREKDDRLREEEARRSRAHRLATEGQTVGLRLWEELQATLKIDVAEFNEQFGSDIMRHKALGNGTFEVRLGEPGEPEKIAVAKYSPDSTTMTWEVVGGVKGVPITVGIKSDSRGMASIDELLFTTGNSYPTCAKISEQIISSLLP